MSQPSREELANRFTYHPPQADQVVTYEAIRGEAHKLAEMIAAFAPDSREKDAALERVDESVFWANAAVARHPAEQYGGGGDA